MSDLDTALEQWNAAIADKERLYQSTLGHEDTVENVTRWLAELTAIRVALSDSSTDAAASMSQDMRINFAAIAEQVLANVDKSLNAMRHVIASMN